MDYTDTSIHTHLKDGRRISSIYRKFANPYFESYGWETMLWQYNEIEEEYTVLNSVDQVMELHMKIKSKKEIN